MQEPQLAQGKSPLGTPEIHQAEQPRPILDMKKKHSFLDCFILRWGRQCFRDPNATATRPLCVMEMWENLLENSQASVTPSVGGILIRGPSCVDVRANNEIALQVAEETGFQFR